MTDGISVSRIPLAITILAALMAGCGGGGTQKPSGQDQEASTPADSEDEEADEETVAKGAVEVRAVDPLFHIDTTTFAAGPMTITFKNEGRIAHELRFVQVKNGLALSDVAQMPVTKINKKLTELGVISKVKGGQEASENLKLELKPGLYGMICLIEDAGGTPHSKYGMWKEIEVVDA